MGISLDSHSIHAYTSDSLGQELLRAYESFPRTTDSLLRELTLIVEKSRIRFGELKAMTLSCSEYFWSSEQQSVPNPTQLGDALSQAFNVDCQVVSYSHSAAVHLPTTQSRVLSVSLADSCGLTLFEQGLMVSSQVCENWAHKPLPDFDWIVDGLTPVCRCGQEQCIEQYLSISGIERQYHQIVLKDKPLSIIFAGVTRGNSVDARVYRTFIDQLARSLVEPLTQLTPNYLVLSGEVVSCSHIADDLVMALSRYIDLPLIPKSIVQQSNEFTFALGAALISEKNNNNRFLSA